MTSFFITTTARDTPWNPYAHANYLRVIKAAESGDKSRYKLANHPEEADIVIFVEPQRKYQSDIKCSPMYKEYRRKAVVIDFFDNPVPQLPGLYVGLNSEYTSYGAYQSGFYIRVSDNSMLEFDGVDKMGQDLLFSFVGKVANCGKVRGELIKLKDQRGLLIDRSSNQSDNDIDYVKILCRSKFVLAPRGIGASSWRLFEAMKAGRAPVIISDVWIPPQGIRWSDFSVRVAEKDVGYIPEILKNLETKSDEMGAVAREEWLRCFSTSNSFSWIADRLIDVHEKSICDQNAQLSSIEIFKKSRLGEKMKMLKEFLAVRLK